MNDPKTIQERLRELTWWGGPLSGVYPLIGEAADRIEELEAEVHRLRTAEFIGRLPDYVKELEGERDEAADEIERLRNHLAELKEWDRM